MRNRRVVLAAAVGVVVLLVAVLILWLTRGSDGVADAAADRTTTTTAESTSPASSPTSGSPTASTPHSGTTSATSTPAETTTSAPAPPAATTTVPRPTPAQVNWPAESTPRYGQELWAVYLAVAEDYTDAEQARMDAVYRDLQAVGYTGLNGALCDDGADAVGVDPYGSAVAVYFASQAAAQQFLAGWDGPSVGSTKITVICGD